LIVPGFLVTVALPVTDGADHAAADDWQKNLPRAAASFLEQYRQLSARAGLA